MRYCDFDLLVGDKRTEGYRVRVIESPAGQADGFLDIDPGSPPVMGALTRLETGDTEEVLLKDLGERLFNALFCGGIRDVFHHSLGQVRAKEDGLRIRLRIEPPALSALPWEYVYDPEGHFYLATSPEILVSRYVQVPQPLAPLLTDLPLRVLLATASPSGLPLLDAEEEEARIRAALNPLIESQLVELDTLHGATGQRIRSQLQDCEYHVFHFIGHGDFHQGQGYLALVDKDSGRGHLIDAQDFSTFFLGYRPMRLILLNACKSAQTGTKEAWVGMAPQLVQRGISAVIAMRYPVSDKAAALFSEAFYGSLAKGRPVDVAVSGARRAILQDIGRDRRDFGIPVLFMRAEDGVIVEFHERKRDMMTDLGHELETCARCYSVLWEWKRLHRLLQQLEGYVDLMSESVRGRSEDIPPHLQQIKSTWRQCSNTVSYELVPFAEGIEHIGRRYERVDGRRSGEKWVLKIVQAQTDITQDLKQPNLVPLQEHIGELDSLITRYLGIADDGLQAKRSALSNSYDKLCAIMANEPSKVEWFDKLAQFIQFQKRLLECMDLHKLYQALRARYIPTCKCIRRRRPEELDAVTVELIEMQWRTLENTVLRRLEDFAQDISYIGRAYQEQGNALCGEKWMIELRQRREAIDQALKDRSKVLLHESVDRLGSLIGGQFTQVDCGLEGCVRELGELSAGLRERIES